MTLKKHLLRQIIHHPNGISQDQLVEQTALAGDVPSHEHRGNILDWIDFLVTTGHIRRHGENITPEQVATLMFQDHLNDVMINGTVNSRFSDWLLH